MLHIKASKKDSITLNKLHVGNDVFTGKDVGKGFFASISSLKSRDVSSLESCPTFQEFVTDHNHILEICKLGKKIPLLSYDKAEELLRAIRPSVTDFYSISALHYLNGRGPAINHFKLVLNAVLSDIETSPSACSIPAMQSSCLRDMASVRLLTGATGQSAPAHSSRRRPTSTSAGWRRTSGLLPKLKPNFRVKVSHMNMLLSFLQKQSTSQSLQLSSQFFACILMQNQPLIVLLGKSSLE